MRSQARRVVAPTVNMSLTDLVTLAKCAGAWELKQHLMQNTPNLSTVSESGRGSSGRAEWERERSLRR